MSTGTSMPIRTRRTVTARMSEGSGSGRLVPLLCWLSPAFPVGAYAYSHGLEWAVEAGDVTDQLSLEAWLATILVDGAGRNDAILLASAYRAASAQDAGALGDVNDLALALAPSAELRLETGQQGRSFLDAALAAWPHPRLGASAAALSRVAYPVALGVAASAHGVPLGETVPSYLTAFAANLVSAAIRLAPIGQTAGQAALAQLVPRLIRLAGETIACDLDDVGGATFRADLGSFRHETQYSRLFRS